MATLEPAEEVQVVSHSLEEKNGKITLVFLLTLPGILKHGHSCSTHSGLELRLS